LTPLRHISSQDGEDPASIIDAATTGSALLIGSLPPEGRDYDLLVEAGAVAPVEAALRSHHFESFAGRWIRLRETRAEIVELVRSTDWQLSSEELDDLFSCALPLAGRSHLSRPSPAHELLILARKLPRTPGLLEAKHRKRIAAALASDPDAFGRAHRQASRWGVGRRLRRLERRYRHPALSRLASRIPRLRRNAIVALSGLDGVGKSTQARLLQSALQQLGYEVHVTWTPFGSAPLLRRGAAGAKRLLAHFRYASRPSRHRSADQQRLLSEPGVGLHSKGLGRRLAAWVWATVSAFANAVAYRRSASVSRVGGRVVIHDRYVLDTIVELRFNYAPQGRLRLPETLVRLLSPKPRCALLLEADPEVAHARKPDWSLAQTATRADLYERLHSDLGVRPIDATAAPDEVARRVLSEALAAIAPAAREAGMD
jgi:thymidylate kinase